MVFAYPWVLLLGAVAATGPLLVHWLTRPRPVRMPLSTVRFVRQVIQQRRSLHRLRDALILAARTAAILLLAIAFAGPQWGGRPLVSPDDTGDAVRVVVLDVSASMAAQAGPAELMQQGRHIAGRYLQYRPGLRANLIFAGARPQAVFEEPSMNLEVLRDELSRSRVRSESANVAAALEMAAEMLMPQSPTDQRRRELVIVSDFQRSNWAAARFDQFPPDTRIQMESVAPREQLDNLAITRAVGRPIGVQQEQLLVEIDVGNFTSEWRQVEVELTVGDSVHRISSLCPPRDTTRLTQQLPSRTVGWHWGEARLVDVEDALAADNVRPLVVQVYGQPRYAMLTREPPQRQVTASHLVELALASGARDVAATDSRLTRVDPDLLDNQSLAASDVVLLVRCGRLSDDAINLLAGQLRRGRSMLYIASDAADASNIQRLADVAGGGLQMPVRFVPPPPGQSRRNLFLTSVRRDEPPFNALGDSLPAFLSLLRFNGGLHTERVEATQTAVEDTILATFSDGTAGMVLTSYDAGMMAVINADLSASNIWQTAAFVPLLDELIQLLLERRVGDPSHPSGQYLVARLPGEAGLARELTITPPPLHPPDAEIGRLTDQAAGAVWLWDAPELPGVYRVQRGEQTVMAVAVGMPAEESDLETLTPEVVLQRLSSGHHVHFRDRAGEDQHQHDLWKWFVIAALMCLMAELGLLTSLRT